MYVDGEAYKSLELGKIIEVFSGELRSELGLSALLKVLPCSSMEQLEKRQALLRDCESFQSIYGDIPWNAALRPVLPLLDDARKSARLSGPELLSIKILLALSMKVRELLGDRREEYPSFSIILRKLRDFSPEMESLSVLDDDGQLYDSASKRLSDLRSDLNSMRRRIRRIGNDLINKNSISAMLQERVLKLRNGRFSMMVRQEQVGRFPGIVVDRSASGNTVYMEPNAIVPLNNRIALLAQEERDEVERILTELTSGLLKRENAIGDAEESLGVIDLLQALSRYMYDHRWIIPQMSKRPEFKLLGVHHPLLGKDAVPIDIHCGKSFRTLIITGPNTGGKTVALKTVGVCVWLAWCGFPIPALEGSVVGTLSAIFADIGDEQSIEQSLSTFSAHLRNIISILKHSDRSSLVLLDELGAGTDPQEGAALGIALLEELRRKRCVVLATTHHNPIKKYATTTSGVETASVDFDLETLSPTYHLVMGIPGQSNAIAIAARLGMPKIVVDAARGVLKGGEASVEHMISELQKKSLMVAKTTREIAVEKAEIARLKAKYEARLADIEAKRDKILISADRKAERLLNETEQTARELLKGLSGAAESAAHREMGQQKEKVDRIRQKSLSREEKRLSKETGSSGGAAWTVGDNVEMVGSGTVGEILSIEGRKAMVQMGIMRVEVSLKKLRATRKKKKDTFLRGEISVSKPVGVPSSIMVRGMTVDEAMPLVSSYLDQAMRAGYGDVVVIHGRGEGILRRKVHELCAKLNYVESYRLGGPGEGGYGVTIVRFKK